MKNAREAFAAVSYNDRGLARSVAVAHVDDAGKLAEVSEGDRLNPAVGTDPHQRFPTASVSMGSDCAGGPRCRCTLVATYDEADPTLQEPGA